MEFTPVFSGSTGQYPGWVPGFRPDPNLIAALVFYVAYPVGVWGLAVTPALEQRAVKTALIKGGVLGAIAYGTFAVTNLSVLQGWTATLTVVDVIWGTCVTAAVAAAGYFVAR